jgi:hypothetical protein
MEDAVNSPYQAPLPLIGRLDGPSVAAPHVVKACSTYREACRTAWALRRVRNMTQRGLAEQADLRPQLVTDYLNPDDKPSRKSLPAERIASFEAVVGNSLVSQWLAARARLTVLEELQARAA